MLDADPRRIKRVRITAAEGAPRAAARPSRASAASRDAVLAGTTPPTLPADRRTRAKIDDRRQRPPRRAARDAHPPRACDRARLRLAARRSSPSSPARASALALAPFNAWPVLFLTFPVLVWLVDGAAAGRCERRAGARPVAGWWFGFGYFLAGLYWVGYAFLVDAKTFGWLLPFAVAGLPAVSRALHRARRLPLARLIWVRGPMRVLALAVALTVAEWLRGHLFSGFPWNAFGYALTEPLALAQSVVADRHLGADVSRGRDLRQPGRAGRRPRRHAASVAAPLLGVAVVLAALAGYGAVRLRDASDRVTSTA